MKLNFNGLANMVVFGINASLNTILFTPLNFCCNIKVDLLLDVWIKPMRFMVYFIPSRHN